MKVVGRALQTVFIILVSLLGAGCLLSDGRIDNDSSAMPFARVVTKVYSRGWKTAEEYKFFPDSKYIRVIYGLGDEKATSVEGVLPANILRSLQDKVAKSKEFKKVDGIATYEFGIDDNMNPDTDGIQHLVHQLQGN